MKLSSEQEIINFQEVSPGQVNKYWSRIVISHEDSKEYPGGKGWSYIDTDVCGALTVNAGFFEMAPGAGSAETELHSHSQEEFSYIISGKGLIAVEDEYHHFEAGDFVFVPAFARHGWKNNSDEPLRILFYRPIKAEPPRQENAPFDLRRFNVKPVDE